VAELLTVVVKRETRTGSICLNLDENMVEAEQFEDFQGLTVAGKRHQK
jgi:hypothetical protein